DSPFFAMTRKTMKKMHGIAIFLISIYFVAGVSGQCNDPDCRKIQTIVASARQNFQNIKSAGGKPSVYPSGLENRCSIGTTATRGSLENRGPLSIYRCRRETIPPAEAKTMFLTIASQLQQALPDWSFDIHSEENFSNLNGSPGKSGCHLDAADAQVKTGDCMLTVHASKSNDGTWSMGFHLYSLAELDKLPKRTQETAP